MQEEVTQKTIALSVNVGKGAARLTEQALQKAIQKFWSRKANPRMGNGLMRQLMKQNGVFPTSDHRYNIKAFREYREEIQHRFLPKRLRASRPVTLCFQRRDADVMTAVFQEFSAKKLNREKKPSIRKALAAEGQGEAATPPATR